MQRLNIDELIYISEREAKEQENTIKYLEELEEFKYYIAPHREAKKKCEQIAEYLKELKQYKDLEEQGLLKRFPCKDGDILYTISNKGNVIWIAATNKYLIKDNKVCCECTYGQNTIYVSSNDIGRTVFLTQEEAEVKGNGG